MNDSLDSIKSQVRKLRPYSLAFERADIKLNQNENPWDAPGEIKIEAMNRIRDRVWSRYPHFVPTSLHEKLADFSGWRMDGIIAGNGSNELIQAVLMVTVDDAKRVLINEPTFALYKQVATLLGGDVVSVPLTPELTYDVEAVKAAMKSADAVVTIFCSPNNPTGCVIDQSDLVSVLEAARGLVVIDEAYFEFSRQSAVPLLKRHENLVVLRTFSKAMGMAALRVGYLLASPELVREIAKAVLPYNLNAMSQTAAEVAIELYDSKLAPLVGKILAERDRLFDELSNIEGLSPVQSRANFMVVRSAIQPRLVYEELLRRGILIRDVSGYPMLQDYFRVSVGTPEETDLLISALRETFKGFAS
jgi:histidinol-phosphate aminotransferase